MPGLKPLSARSVVLSLVLGAERGPGGGGLTAGQLVAAGEHFGLPAPTVRVALTRAVAGGDLQRDHALYRLGPRQLARRERQALHASPAPWDGGWELAVVVAAGRPSAERAALRTRLAELRLAELREGVWLRPANLARALHLGADDGVQVFGTVPDDPVALAASLWDLDGWAREAGAAVDLLGRTHDPAERLAAAAQLVRHLATDPLLPDALTPAGWPAAAAREAAASYEAEVREVTRGAARDAREGAREG